MLRTAQSNIQVSSEKTKKKERKPLTKVLGVWWSSVRKMWEVTWAAELGHTLIPTLAFHLALSQSVFIIHNT